MIVVDVSALTAFILREEGYEGIAEYFVKAVSVDHVLKELLMPYEKRILEAT